MIKRFALAVAMLCALTTAHAIPVAPFTSPHVTFVNGVGLPCAGCKLFSYNAGTTTPLATYTDSTGTSQNTNPIILDAAGGAQIWLGANSYKFILKDALSATIWSVDNVNAGNLFPCGPAGAVQIANSAVNGLTCDANITINTSSHTLNIGTLGPNFVTIGALSTPTSWTFDTTSPATALASLLPGYLSVTPYGAKCDGTTDDTTAIQAAIAAAKIAGPLATPTGIFFPAGTCIVSAALDVTGLRVFGINQFSSIVKMKSGTHVDVFQTQGQATFDHLGINGSWDGTTTGLNGNGISTLSNPTAYYGYQNQFSDLRIQQVGKYGIYINDGAYEAIHNVQINAVGLDDLYLDSGATAGFVTTSTVIDGLTILSDAPNGYGAVINNGIDVRFAGVTTMEGTQGIELLGGAGRNISIENVYQEGNAGAFVTGSGSAGQGLKIENNFGPGTTGVSAASVSGWFDKSIRTNDFGNQPASTAYSEVLPQTPFGSDDVMDVTKTPFTFTGTASNVGQNPITGTHWSAVLIGMFSSNGSTAGGTPAISIVSDANPSVTVESGSVTFSLASGILQATATLGGGQTFIQFQGEIFIESRNNSDAAGASIRANDGLVAGGHIDQTAANNFAGSCTMAAGTSCTMTLLRAFNSAPACFVTAVGTNAIAGSCAVSSTTVTVTAASSNSLIWSILLIGNPN